MVTKFSDEVSCLLSCDIIARSHSHTVLVLQKVSLPLFFWWLRLVLVQLIVSHYSHSYPVTLGMLYKLTFFPGISVAEKNLALASSHCCSSFPKVVLNFS